MAKSDADIMAVHEDSALFRESVLHTARETGFLAELVEKDYFCSLILNYLYAGKDFGLIFKGGTCLSKIHSDFYRLSEDLDFIIPISPKAPRSERSKAANPLRAKVEAISKNLPVIEVPGGCRGHNNSKQYIADAQYVSSVTSRPEKIKIEIGLREEMLLGALHSEAKTLLTDPFKGKPAVAPFPVVSMSLKEAYAEKVRAALTRKEPAIRDFFDVDFAAQKLKFDLHEKGFIELVRAKLSVPDNDPIDVSASRKANLEKQLDTQLKSVLRSKDFDEFKLRRAFDTIVDLGKIIEGH